jgi:hypothetical protein
MAINLPPPTIVWNNTKACDLASDSHNGLTPMSVKAIVKFPDGFVNSDDTACLTEKQFKVYLHWMSSLPGGEAEGFSRTKFVDSKHPNVLRATP